ncbi:unnamed protein product [Notodromas monacha]|uniref:Protein-lysine N-methyltransferase SMYD4 n=1 Tax=Notodromas monacha TaxID=399045 RepID=A0A7R9BNN0_9CRUS|nr:unnamed protein product [Notodromas monacha]CAG0918855.1 unnamed protein product [Notodromas monacha]
MDNSKQSKSEPSAKGSSASNSISRASSDTKHAHRRRSSPMIPRLSLRSLANFVLPITGNNNSSGTRAVSSLMPSSRLMNRDASSSLAIGTDPSSSSSVPHHRTVTAIHQPGAASVHRGEKGAEDAFAIAEDYASFREDFPVTELEAALKRDSRLSAALRDVMSGQNFLLKLNVVSQRVAKDESIARQNLNATKMYIPKSMKAWLIKQKFKVLHNIAPSGIVGSLREMLVNEDTDRDIKDLKKEVKPVGKFGYDRSGRPLNEPLAEAETHPDDIIFRPDGKENMLISGASDAIVLKYKPNRGRYYVAARQIQPGEILLVEKPYASVLFADRWASNCQYCGDEVQNGVPCQDCAAVIFCSDTCIRKAKQFHDIECGHMRNLAQFAVPLGGYLAYRMITCHPLDYFLQRKKDISRMLDPSTRVMPLGFMQANEYINVFCLTDHADQKSADEIRENMITALYFTKLLESAEYFGKDPRMEDKVYIAMLLLRNLMVFDCSHFTYHQRLLSEKNGLVEPDDRGMAIFSACSLANHSCNPNASHYFVKSHLVFRSFGVIQEGEDVTISYGEVFASSDRDTRRDYLKGYYFNCGCEACAGDWPQLDDIETKLKCPHCRTQVPGEKVEDMLKLSCPQCKMAWKTFVLQFMNVKKLALEAEEKLKNGDVKNIRDHVWHVQEYLKALYVVTSKPDAEFYTVANDLTYLHNLESLVVQREAEDLHFVKAESVGVAIKSEKTGKRRSGKTKGSSSKESVGDEDHIRGPPPPPGSNYGQYLP